MQSIDHAITVLKAMAAVIRKGPLDKQSRSIVAAKLEGVAFLLKMDKENSDNAESHLPILRQLDRLA